MSIIKQLQSYCAALLALSAAAWFGLAEPAVAARGPSGTPEAGARCVHDCFVLTGLTIDGVTAYPMATLAPLYSDALAREVDMADLVEIAQRITNKYLADGYFLSRAALTSQPDAAGHVRIRVYEGYISETVYKGQAVDRKSVV